VTPTVDDFQALARSSPWRWTTLHFVHRSGFPGDCEAWVRRPGQLLVRTPDGREHRESGLPYSSTTMVASDDPDFVPPPDPVLPHQAAPVLRPDGLVAERPSIFDVNYDDPMHGNYSWVAMLDPVELSHHVEVSDVHADEIAGRPAWWASVRALEGYDPRCSCCALIWSAVSDSYEYDSPQQRAYPDHYDIALDVQAGVVVRWRPVGGDPDASWLENDILEVA
jgi:hypothetical protein